MDITPVFNDLLRKRNAPIITEKKLSLEAIDGFLKEAYRIVSLYQPPLSILENCMSLTP